MAGSADAFVGRQVELGRLLAALEDAGRGEPGTMLVGGEAGIGKTTLMSAFARGATAARARVLVGGCIELGAEGLPYVAVSEALRAYLADAPNEERELVASVAEDALVHLVPSLVSGRTSPASLSQHQLFESILAALTSLSEGGPVAFVLEDLHWAERSTLELVAFLGRALRRTRVLLVCTFRTDELHRRHPLRPLLAQLERSSHVDRLDLPPLSPAEVREQLAQLEARIAPAAADVIAARAEGNPFYVEQLAAAGAVTGAVPPSLSDTLLVHFDDQPDETKALLRIAAAAGRTVPHDLLVIASDVGGPDVSEALRPAVEKGLITADTRAYTFRHALLAEAVAATLLPGERFAVHRALAGALAARPDLAASSAPSAELAHHWVAAQDLPRALTASLSAIEETDRVHAASEALRHVTNALELWDRVPPDARSGVDHVALLARAAHLSHRVGEAAAAVRYLSAAMDEAADDPMRRGELAAELATYLGDQGRYEAMIEASDASLALLAGAPSHVRARALAVQASALSRLGRPRDALPVAESAIAAAGDASTRPSLLLTLGSILLDLGELEDAVHHLEEGRAAAAAAGDVDIELRAWNQLVIAHDLLGDAHHAADLGLEGLEHARRHGFEGVLGPYLACNTTNAMAIAGRWGEALEVLDDVLEPSDVVPVTNFALHRAEIETLRGDVRAATRLVDQARAGITEVPILASTLAARSSVIALLEDRYDDARALVREAIDMLDTSASPEDAPELCWLAIRVEADRLAYTAARRTEQIADVAPREADAMLTLLEAQLGEHPRPEPLAWQATARAERSRIEGGGDEVEWAEAAQRWARVGSPHQEAYCWFRQAEVAVAAGERQRAEELVRQAYAAANGLGARPLADAITDLAKRGRLRVDARDVAPAPTTPSTWHDEFGLTKREAEVLALVAEGLTNRQVGRDLYISEKTASVHVTRILQKLGASNRVEAAAIAHRRMTAGV